MCGRFTLAAELADLKAEFAGIQFPAPLARRYNVAPSQPVLAIPNDGQAKADYFVWGLIPSWAKDASIGNRLINARGETLAEKPAFRSSYKYKRCLVLADGFFEWKTVPGTKAKTPIYVQLEHGTPFGMAGLWSAWHAADGSEVRSCTIITTAPNALIAPIHNRMPVILRAEDRSKWLDPAPQSPDVLGHLLQPYPAERMKALAVSTLVNNPGIDRAECVLPS
ncbi:MAG TPA: SOS response-associated peptidase [Anaerolineales bacterium]|nr:SOS response-associated peptidase [Anaerolineales bacterium]